MQLRVRANKQEYFDFSNISNDKHFMVQFNKIANQLIKDNQVNLINYINEFIIQQSQTKIRNNEIKQNIQKEKSNYEQGKNYNQSFIEQQIQFTRKQVFILLLMMYSNAIDKDNQNMQQSGFYQINMELIKQSQCKQSQEKLKCIHSYFINFYNRFLKQDQVLNNDQQLNQNLKQIQDLEKEIQEEEYKHSQKIQYLNQKIEMIRNQLLNNNNEQDEFVTYIRRTEFRQYNQIFNDQQYLLSYFTKNKGRCEDYQNSVLVNFADKNVGGLSLDTLNIAQEEVLMLTHPEALISMLFMKPMDDNEAILIKNVIRFNDYDGYGQTFRQKDEDYFKLIQNSSFKQNNEFSQQKEDVNKLTQNKKIIKNHILCMDALYYKNWQLQFDQVCINRELTKSYIAFSLALDYTNNENISTGKWGCGIFNGDVQLKFLIQLLAFSKALQDNKQKNEQNKIQDYKNKTERMIIFSAFNDNQFDDLIQFYENALMKKDQKYCKTIIQEIENVKLQIKQQNNYGPNR
ncbi:unnamed protein product [Paramecium primaurelia]|uniref:PARG catalytic Macro domain-containing protein n=1 Tax=Paramecium primaurelia TaxID=5886 RepID=A0A8S1L9G7_PARPR|nr:unnamed protein product [Paramecium primaurelia]